MWRRAIGEQLFAAAKHDRHREDAHSVDQVIGEQRVHEFGAALGDEVWAVFLLQPLQVGDVAQEHRARPTRIDLARARNHVFLDLVELLGDAAMGSVVVLVRPVPSENLVGLAAEQEVEFLLEDAVELFAELLMPCFVYIDECHDYIARDANVTAILEQARKQKVGLVLAHQYLSQISQSVLESLFSNTSVKFASGISDRDAHAVARELRTTPSFIAEQQTGSWAAYVKNQTGTAISLKVPFGSMEKLERMDADERHALRERMRDRYSVRPDQPIVNLHKPDLAWKLEREESVPSDDKPGDWS